MEEAIKPAMFQGKEWDPRRHIHEMPTDAFGDISFKGMGQKVGKVRFSPIKVIEIYYLKMSDQHSPLFKN